MKSQSSIFTSKQVEMIRSELNATYQRKLSDIGKQHYSVSKLGREIEDKFSHRTALENEHVPAQFKTVKEVYLVESSSGARNDNFRKFMKGNTQRMEDIKLLACEVFLTIVNNNYSTLTKEALYSENAAYGAPILLAQFLNPSGVVHNLISAQLICSQYFSKTDECEHRLVIEESGEDCVFFATLIISHFAASSFKSDKKKSSQKKN